MLHKKMAKKITTALIYLTGLLCNIALGLVGLRILQAGYFSGRAGHIASGPEAVMFGALFVALGLGGAVYLLIAYAKHLLGKRRPDDADTHPPH